MSESLGSLYLRLGLSLDDLTSDFISAERSITDNMRRLNREMQVIRLRTDIDLSGIDDATERFRVQQNSLTGLINAQRQKINLANAAYTDMVQRLGENSAATQRALVALERERAALSRLEEELTHLNEMQDEFNHSQNSFAGISDKLTNKLSAPIEAFQKLCDSINLATEATSSLVDDFKELQKQSYELNLPLDVTSDFLRHLKLGGGDIGDFEGYIRGISDAYVKGDVDDPEFIALSKYEAKITDATGRLKNFKDITEEVFQAWKKADAAGEGIEFLQLTGGESGIRDAIQFFKRYEEAKSDAAKIANASLNSDELHQADREFNLLAEQASEFSYALKDLVTPSIRAAIKELFDIFHSGTKFLIDCKDEFQKFQLIAIEVAKSTGKIITNIIKLADTPLSATDGFASFSEQQNQQLKEIYKTIDDLKNPNNSFGVIANKKFYGDLFDELFADSLKRAEQVHKNFNSVFQQGNTENQKSWADFKKEIEKPIQLDNNPLSQYAAQRIKSFKEELQDLRNEIDNFDNDFAKSIGEVEIWKQRELIDKLHVSKEEEAAIYDLYNAKIEQIEQEHADKIKEIRNEIAAPFRSDLQNQLADIDKNKKDWIKEGLPIHESEIAAQKQKNEAINSLEEEFAQARDAIHQSELDKRLFQIEQEKQAWIQKGIDEIRATELAEQQKAEAIKQANEEFNEAYNKLTLSPLQQQLAEIEKQKQAWLDKGINEIRVNQWSHVATSDVLKNELQSHSDKIEAELNKCKQFEEEVATQIDSIYKDELSNRLDSIEQEKQAWIQKGLDEVKATKWAEEAKSKEYRNSALQILKQEKENYKAFLKGGYEGLRKKMLDDLKKQGISQKDLDMMKPDDIQAYNQAKNLINNNLFPKLATDSDKKLAQAFKDNEFKRDFNGNRLSSNDKLFPLDSAANNSADSLAKFGGIISAASLGLLNFGVANANAGDALTSTAQAAISAAEALSNFADSKPQNNIQNPANNAPQNVNVQPAQYEPSKIVLPPNSPYHVDGYAHNPELDRTIYSAKNALGQSVLLTPQQIQNEIANGRNFTFDPDWQTHASINGDLDKLMRPFQNAVKDLNNILSSDNLYNSSTGHSSSQPHIINVQNNTNINEATAWDSEHINQLADKVAGVMEPALSRAIGGDDNSY